VPTLTVKNFDVPAHEPPVSRNQCLPAWIATVAEPQKTSAFFPSTFAGPGLQDARAPPAPPGSETASRRAMQAARTIGSGRLRGRP
jgi:hypothetical protein